MMLNKRIQRALDYVRGRRDDAESKLPEDYEVPLEKNDTLAMIIAALIVLLPVALIVLGIIALIGLLMFAF